MEVEEDMTYDEYVVECVPPEEWTDRDRQAIAFAEQYRDSIKRNKWWRRFWRWVLSWFQ